jgi:phospholipid transport system substrate-binding protein
MRVVKSGLITMAWLALSATSLVAVTPSFAVAESGDPAAKVIENLDTNLLDMMKAGKSLGAEGRFKLIAPTVRSSYDLSGMVRHAVGQTAWAGMSPAEQAQLTAAFERFSAATYAHNFDEYSGEKFVVTGVDTRLPDKLVRTQIVHPPGAPVSLVYRMQAIDGRWRIVDVYFMGSISELAQQASDFSATLRSGGSSALIKKLNSQADRLINEP